MIRMMFVVGGGHVIIDVDIDALQKLLSFFQQKISVYLVFNFFNLSEGMEKCKMSGENQGKVREC